MPLLWHRAAIAVTAAALTPARTMTVADLTAAAAVVASAASASASAAAVMDFSPVPSMDIHSAGVWSICKATDSRCESSGSSAACADSAPSVIDASWRPRLKSARTDMPSGSLDHLTSAAALLLVVVPSPAVVLLSLRPASSAAAEVVDVDFPVDATDLAAAAVTAVACV